ncbi:MAG: transcription antitermination factor NusB [Bacteroidia bacterium]
MLNRRFLRIKIMQALYAFFRDEKADIKVAEKNLNTSIDKTYELFLYLVSFLGNLHFCERISLEDKRAKRLPTKEDLNPNTAFADNLFFTALSNNKSFNNEFTKKGVSWQNDQDLVRKILAELKTTDFYAAYIKLPSRDFAADKKLAKEILSNLLYDHELFNFWFEERNIHWSDDLYFAFVFVNKWLDGINSEEDIKLQPLYRDPEGDKQFVIDLFYKTIKYSDEYNPLIEKNTANWELERIATLDVLLMKMALTEVLHLSNIPVKVSINEYIDLAKEYSSPQSGRFINGVLDKMVIELKKDKKINKTGRGLLES